MPDLSRDKRNLHIHRSHVLQLTRVRILSVWSLSGAAASICLHLYYHQVMYSCDSSESRLGCYTQKRNLPKPRDLDSVAAAQEQNKVQLCLQPA
jgi:hypothetical protein